MTLFFLANAGFTPKRSHPHPPSSPKKLSILRHFWGQKFRFRHFKPGSRFDVYGQQDGDLFPDGLHHFSKWSGGSEKRQVEGKADEMMRMMIDLVWQLVSEGTTDDNNKYRFGELCIFYRTVEYYSFWKLNIKNIQVKLEVDQKMRCFFICFSMIHEIK